MTATHRPRVLQIGKMPLPALDADLAQVKKVAGQPRVLFIYARGAGTLFVAGSGTPAETMIELAGGRNAATGFADFKPLTAEAMILFEITGKISFRTVSTW